jgi:hypothetical protein
LLDGAGMVAAFDDSNEFIDTGTTGHGETSQGCGLSHDGLSGRAGQWRFVRG